MRLHPAICAWKGRFGFVIALGLLIPFFSSQYRRAHEPRIDGRPVTDWIADLNDSKSRNEAAKKLRSAKPEILPYLIDALDDQDGLAADIRARIVKGGTRTRWLFGEIATPSLLRCILGITVNEIARSHPLDSDSDFVAAAARIAELIDTRPEQRINYAMVLSHFGDRAQVALPSVLRIVRAGPSPRDAQNLIYIFGQIGSGSFGPEIAGFATNFLCSTGTGDRLAAIRAIGVCGPAGRAAAPAIVAMLGDDPMEHGTIFWTLARLDAVPKELKPQLAQALWLGREPWYAAAAMLRIDPNDPTALAAIRTRLHPAVNFNERQRL